MELIKEFEQINKSDIAIAGGKGASLGEMTQAGIPVPPGFVVTTEAFRQFHSAELSEEFKQQVLVAFDQLGAERVAVRSSAVAEDSKSASWAGQLESYLNITRDGLIDAVKLCWQSIQSERALSYAVQQGITEDELVVAVVVQKMVNSEAAGVMFTLNPVTNDDNELMIEGCFGLGELLVQGMITPDNYLVIKDSLEITSQTISTKEKMLQFEDGENKEMAVPADKVNTPVLSEEQIKGLAELGKKIEAHYGSPQDIEWALENDQIYILQSRPITTIFD